MQVVGIIRSENGRPGRFLDEPAHFVDMINISVDPVKTKAQKIAEFYLSDELSAAQIADRLGISKTVVLKKLHSLGVRSDASKAQQMTNPKNYRATFVPYGYRKVDGQLVVNKKEMKICRLVVQFVDEQGLSLHGTARELMRRKIKNRKGNVWWDHSMVRGIFRRWDGKV